MKGKNRKRNIKVIAILGIIVIGIIFLVQFNPFAIYIGDSGAGTYEPSTEYNVGIPVLDEISPEVDYDGLVNLRWSLITAYDITGFYIFDRYEGSDWRFRYYVSGEVYSSNVMCYSDGMFGFRIMGIAMIDGETHLSDFSVDQYVQISSETSSNIPILKVIESPNTDGTIELDWNVVEPFADLGTVMGYTIYRYFVSEGWIELDYVLMSITEYVDTIDVDGEYQYYITSTIYTFEMVESEPSNVRTVYVSIDGDPDPDPDPDPVYPTNPTISINDGDATTDSLTITLTLSCDDATKMQFEIYDNLLSVVAYSETYEITFSADGPDYPDYVVGVIFGNDDGYTDIIYDEIEYVDITEILPTNPSILINNGASTTNSFVNLLTLSCDDAEEMKFQINDGVWSDWIVYSTTYTIILIEGDPSYPDYDIEVIFRNDVGTSEDAGYNNIHDTIIYDLEGLTPPGDGEEVDYTLVYVLVVILGGLIGIVVFIAYKKKKDNRPNIKKVQKRIKKGKNIGWGW